MESLLKDLDAVIDLSRSETEQIVSAFKHFVDRNFHVDQQALDTIFKIPSGLVLNQQEDEDDMHAHYGEMIYNYAAAN